jgi:hypothetical protein
MIVGKILKQLLGFIAADKSRIQRQERVTIKLIPSLNEDVGFLQPRFVCNTTSF